MFPTQHQCRPFAICDFLAPMVETTVLKYDDAGVGTRFAFPHLCELRLRTQRIPDKHRVRKPYICHTKIRHCSSQSGIADRQTDHKAKCEDAVDQPLTELRSLVRPLTLGSSLPSDSILSATASVERIVGILTSKVGAILELGHLPPPMSLLLC